VAVPCCGGASSRCASIRATTAFTPLDFRQLSVLTLARDASPSGDWRSVTRFMTIRRNWCQRSCSCSPRSSSVIGCWDFVTHRPRHAAVPRRSEGRTRPVEFPFRRLSRSKSGMYVGLVTADLRAAVTRRGRRAISGSGPLGLHRAGRRFVGPCLCRQHGRPRRPPSLTAILVRRHRRWRASLSPSAGGWTRNRSPGALTLGGPRAPKHFARCGDRGRSHIRATLT